MAAPPIPHPSPWRRLAPRLAAVAAAVGVGLALQHVVAVHLEAIQARAATDVVAARRELALVLQVAAVAILALAGGLGAAIALSGRRALAEGRFPPSGALAWGSARAPLTGPRAQRFARAGIVLGVLLVVCSGLAGGLLWWMARALLLCRAGAG